MAVSLALLPAISLLLLFQCGSTALIPQLDAQPPCGNRPDRQLILELEDAKLKVDRFGNRPFNAHTSYQTPSNSSILQSIAVSLQSESILEESIQHLHAKILSIGQSEKLIEEMSRDIDYLQSALVSLKGDSSREDERLNVLEEEVRLLWAASRKNNFELHTLETKARDTEARLEVVTSQVEKMADIVAEQWIQIQQLEQALQITEMQILKVKRQGGSTRCTFVKFIKNLLNNHLETSRLMVDPYLSDKGFPLSSSLSRALHQLAKTFSAAQHYHHQLQGYIKQEMERNEFTAAFANREVVFFVASALILFPILSAWMCLVSQVS